MQAAIFPGKYIQGRHATDSIGDLIRPLGGKALLLFDRNVRQCAAEPLRRALDGSSIQVDMTEFGGECTRNEIDRVAGTANSGNCDVIIGAGGGKTIDTAKAAAEKADKWVVIVPTTASTDAPTSALSVIYTEQGEFQEYRFLRKNPDMVLMDLDIIAMAPARFLVAGMGDALATWFEADATSRAGKKNMAGGYSTMTGLTLARLCYDTLLQYGPMAVLAVTEQVITPPLQRVVEANTLLSGIGFESGGLAAAHSIHNGLTELEPTHKFLHGEKVSFGTLTQLVLENRSADELETVLGFMALVGLLATLEAIGLADVSRDDLRRVAVAATKEGETIHNEPFPVTADDVLDAMIAADALARSFPSGIAIGGVIEERRAA